MVKLWWRAKGPERAILVTDAMSAAGMPDGDVPTGRVCRPSVATAGPSPAECWPAALLTLDRALSNFIEFTGAP